MDNTQGGFMTGVLVDATRATRISGGDKFEAADHNGANVIVGIVVSTRESKLYPGSYMVYLKDCRIIPFADWKKQNGYS